MSFGIPVRNGLSISLLSTTSLSSGRGYSAALNLDFLTGALDPRITFSRTSQATLVDSTGKLTYAPNNLLTNSEDFEAAAWLKLSGGTGSAPVITSNAGVAPNGTTTADRLVLNRGSGTTSNDLSRIFQGAVITSGVGVFSVWLRSFDGVSSFAITLTNGSVSSNITVTGSWQRFSLVSSNTTANAQVRLQGDVGPQTADLLVWGAQLEQVTYQTTPGTYNSTSPSNLLGYTQEFDNAAWTKSNAFVQTNLLTYSQDFSNPNWTLDNGSAVNPVVTANQGIAPDGTNTADRIVFNKTGGTFSRIQQSTVTASAVYTFSVWMRTFSGSGTANVGIRIASDGVNCVVTGAWQRFSVTMLAAAANQAGQILLFDSIPGNDETADVLVWGAQFVQGSTAGDYQRTDAAAAAVQYTAPDGSRTADKLVEDATNNQHSVYRLSTTMTAGAKAVLSLYAKNDGRRYIAVYPQGPGAANAAYAIFDLQTGTVSLTGGAQYISSSITDSGNGWYRCAVSFNVTDPSVHSVFYLSNSSSVASPTYTGDGTSGIYIWGAQLSNSASLDPYVYNPVAAPTSAAYYGPRFDYDPVTLANKGLLIEEQRTNLFLRSQEFDNAAWSLFRCSVTANATTSPDGTANADATVQTTGQTAVGLVSQTFTTIAGSTAITISIYAKANQKTFLAIGTDANGIVGLNAYSYFNLSTGTVGTAAAGHTITMSSAGNGWYRCVLTCTTRVGGGNVGIYCGGVDVNNSLTVTDSGGIYIYGAQLEAGSFATSYIPTVASQVTRTADVALMQGANFSNWWNQNEGTLASSVLDNSIGSRVLTVSDGTVNNQIFMNTSTDFVLSVYTGGVYQAQIGTTPAAPYKIAGNYATNNFAAVANGGTVATDTSGSIASYSRMQIGANSAGTSQFLNGHIRSISYYNTRLGNATLQTLTAPNIIPSLSLDFTTQVFNVG